MENLNNWLTPNEVVYWAKTRLGILKLDSEMRGADIRKTIRWIGIRSGDTMYLEDEPFFGRIGIGLMLTVTLVVFPAYYTYYELWQRN